VRVLTILRGQPFTTEGRASAIVHSSDSIPLATIEGRYVVESVAHTDGCSYGVALLDGDVKAQTIRKQSTRTNVIGAPLNVKLAVESLLQKLAPCDAAAPLAGLTFRCVDLSQWNSYGDNGSTLPVRFEIERVHPEAQMTIGDLAARTEELRADAARAIKWQQVGERIRRQFAGSAAAINALCEPCVDPVAERDRVERKRAFEAAIAELAVATFSQLVEQERRAALPRPAPSERDEAERAATQRRRQRRRGWYNV
jgi:hypothetical protein